MKRCHFLRPRVPTCHSLRPDILLSTLFANSLNLCPVVTPAFTDVQKNGKVMVKWTNRSCIWIFKQETGK
jgi:hypothetical protein